jgi:SAM-dependent methyltransferase
MQNVSQLKRKERHDALSYSLVAPFDWFQLRCLLWEAIPARLTGSAPGGWTGIASTINARCPESTPICGPQCESIALRLVAALPEAQSLLVEPSSAPRVWNHLLYGTVHERLGSPLFMNLGYGDTDRRFENLRLFESDEPYRLFIQLYERTISAVPLECRDVLEVGCGAGGGAYYLSRYHHPGTLHGIDLVEKNVDACRRLDCGPGVSFAQGVAESIDRPDLSADVVINIESSFTYALDEFLRECHRVLRPGGYLLITDHRPVNEEWGPGRSIREFTDQLHSCSFRVLQNDDITDNIIAANAALAPLKQEMLPAAGLSPQDQVHFSEILHCAGSRNYDRLRNREWEYRCVRLYKD